MNTEEIDLNAKKTKVTEMYNTHNTNITNYKNSISTYENAIATAKKQLTSLGQEIARLDLIINQNEPTAPTVDPKITKQQNIIKLKGYGFINDFNVTFTSENLKTIFATSKTQADGFYYPSYHLKIDTSNTNKRYFDTENFDYFSYSGQYIPNVKDLVASYGNEININKIFVEYPYNCRLEINTYKNNNKLPTSHTIPRTKKIKNILKNEGIDAYIRTLPHNTEGGCGGLYWINCGTGNNNDYYAIGNDEYEYEIQCIKETSYIISGDIFTEVYNIEQEPGMESGSKEKGTFYDIENYKLIERTVSNTPVYNTKIIFHHIVDDFKLEYNQVNNSFSYELIQGTYKIQIIKNNRPEIDFINTDGVTIYTDENIKWTGDKINPYFGFKTYEIEITVNSSRSLGNIILVPSMGQEWDEISDLRDKTTSLTNGHFGGKLTQGFPGKNIEDNLKDTQNKITKSYIRDYVNWGHEMINNDGNNLTYDTFWNRWERYYHIYRIWDNGSVTNIQSIFFKNPDRKSTFIDLEQEATNGDNRLPTYIEAKYLVLNENNNDIWIPIYKNKKKDFYKFQVIIQIMEHFES